MIFRDGFIKSGRISYLFLKHIHPKWFADDWKFTPFNGQIQRIRDIVGIVDVFKPDLCIETGTFIGSTTIHLARLAPEGVKSIEINQSFLAVARDRFTQNHKSSPIQTYLGDSAIEITKILSDLPKNKRILAYLDAHWLDAIPTRDEIEALENWGGQWVAIVDDFRIPSDSGFGFDSYGKIIIGSEIFSGITNLEICGPARDSSMETGARRGTGYVTNIEKVPNYSEIFQGLQSITRS